MLIKNRTSFFSLLIVTSALGAWLGGVFDKNSIPKEISAIDLVFPIMGIFIFFGSFIGIVLIIRKRIQSPLGNERIIWEKVRQKGKNNFVIQFTVRGFVYGLIACILLILIDRDNTSVFEDVKVYLEVLIALVFCFFILSLMFWNFFEDKYKAEIRKNKQLTADN